jgi:hypothetical protein
MVIPGIHLRSIEAIKIAAPFESLNTMDYSESAVIKYKGF